MFKNEGTNEVALSAEDRARVDVWSAQLREQFAALAARGIDEFEVQWPLDGPAWAIESETTVEAAGLSVTVTFTGVEHRSGEASAWVTQTFVVNAIDDASPDDPADVIPAGTVSTEGPCVILGQDAEAMAWEEAYQVAAVVKAAARELRRHVDPDHYSWDFGRSDEENARHDRFVDAAEELVAASKLLDEAGI